MICDIQEIYVRLPKVKNLYLKIFMNSNSAKMKADPSKN